MLGFLTEQEILMANSASAKKRARQAEKNRQRNASQQSNLRTYIKKVMATVETGNYENSMAAFKKACALIDTAVNKNLIHKNNAARKKSRLNARVKALSS